MALDRNSESWAGDVELPGGGGPSSNGAEELETLRCKWDLLFIIIPKIQGFQNISLSVP